MPKSALMSFIFKFEPQPMKLKATIPKFSSSLLLLRHTPPSKISFYNYQLLVLQRKEKLSFGSGLVFPGGKIEALLDKTYRSKFNLRSEYEAAALRECFEQTGLYFTKNPLLESDAFEKLSKIKLEYIANELNGVTGTKEKQFQKISQLLPPTQSLIPFIRLITIPQIKQRYDTTFYVLPLEQYKYINFLKYAEHDKYLHSLDKLIFCEKEFDNFRWMNPAEILQQHFAKTSLIHPPQFIMLNIMLQFYKSADFITYLKAFHPHAASESRNLNLGPNIVSLIRNQSTQADQYPYAATLLGDAEFPFDKIIANEQSEPLMNQMKEWQGWQKDNIENGKNRFLFKEGKKFFLSEYEVEANAPHSAIKQMKPWGKVHEILKSATFDKKSE